MNWIIDRFEGDYVLCEIEKGVIVSIPKSALPPEAKEGDCVSVTIDSKETEKRSSNINKLMDDLFVD